MTTDSGLSAALLQLSQHAERIGALDSREAAHFRHIETTLAGMSSAVTSLRGTVDGQAECSPRSTGSASTSRLSRNRWPHSCRLDPGPGYQPHSGGPLVVRR